MRRLIAGLGLAGLLLMGAPSTALAASAPSDDVPIRVDFWVAPLKCGGYIIIYPDLPPDAEFATNCFPRA